MAPLSVGTDTGGSIRCPAGLCGITGLKPTYGRVSRYGLVAFASSLDQIGPLARTAEDVALLLEVLAGHDPLDSTSVDLPVPPYTQDRPASRWPDLRIGLVREHFGDGLDARGRGGGPRGGAGLRVAGGEGEVAFACRTASTRVAAYYIIAPCEASSNLARYDGVHYGYRTDEKRDDWPSWRPQRKRLQKAGDRRRWTSWTIRWSACIAAAGPRALGPRSSGGSCSAPTPSAPATTTPITRRP